MKTWALILTAGAALLWLLLLDGDEPGRRALPERAEAPSPRSDRGEPVPEPGPAAATRPNTEPEPKPKSVYEGVVHGPDGPVWGARVHAYRADGAPCGSAQSRFEGKFKLEIPGGDAVTLEVDPRGGVSHVDVPRIVLGLMPERRVDCAPGVIHEFHLKRGAAVRGRLVRADDKSVPRVNLIAVPRESYERTVALNPLAISYPSVACRCRVGNDATFTLRSLRSGDYVLVVDDTYWKLAEPIRFHSGSPEITGALVPAATLRVTAIDIETLRPIRDVLALLPGGLVAQAQGEFIHARFEVPPGTERPVEAELRAHGFVPRRIEVGEEIRRVFLHRERGPNVILSVVYEDGRPVPVRHAYALFHPDEKAMASESHTFERMETGRFQGTLPAGQWKLDLHFAPHLGTELTATIPPAGFATLEVELKRGGDLVLDLSQGQESLMRRVPVTVARLPKGERTIGCLVNVRDRILDLEPGRYRVTWSFGGDAASREVEIERDRETVVDLSRG